MYIIIINNYSLPSPAGEDETPEFFVWYTYRVFCVVHIQSFLCGTHTDAKGPMSAENAQVLHNSDNQ